MNIQDISTQLIYTTVPIVSQKNVGVSVGTGFIYSIFEGENRTIPLLITNYHVLDGAVAGYIEFHRGENGKPTDEGARVQFDQSVLINGKLGDLDLVAIPLAGTFTDLQRKGIELFYRAVDQNFIPTDEQYNDLAAMEDITFIGYPNGLYDDKNKIPIIRQGISATPIWNRFKGKEEFLIDAGVFPGSSGSPVFIFNQGTYPIKDGISVGNRLLFVGIISQTLSNNITQSYLDLGVAINSKAFLRELEIFIRNLKSKE